MIDKTKQNIILIGFGSKNDIKNFEKVNRKKNSPAFPEEIIYKDKTIIDLK